MTSHTPGPWVADCDHHRRRRRERMALVVTPHGRMSIDCTHSGASYPEDCANARLVAAAPDLYAIVRELLDEMRDNPSVLEPGRAARARAAMAKAEGRS